MKNTFGPGKVALAALLLGSVRAFLGGAEPGDGVEGDILPAVDDMDGDGLLDTEELAIGTRVNHPDTDGDGLLDGWEVNGRLSHGQIEPLPVYGADPRRKDVFVEIDWMTTAEGSAQVNAIIAYQAAADVTRAFRRSGADIRIHFDLGPRIEALIPEHLIEEDIELDSFQDEPDAEKFIPYQEVFRARPACGPGSGDLSLYEVYTGGRFFRPSRRNIFYYAAIVEDGRPTSERRLETVSRRAFTDDFRGDLARRDQLLASGVHVICLSRKPSPDLSPELVRYQYSVNLFHELGHAFGLGHGGAIPGAGWNNNNHKPNYPSIMNYRYQHCGVDLDNGIPVMDFSRGKLRVPLYESSLVEGQGMGELPSERVLACLGLRNLRLEGYPMNIDWDGDGYLSKEPIILDLNENGEIDTRPHGDHDDWGKLVRTGFDGIGRRAYEGCGFACKKGDDVSTILGDFDGDSDQDLFFLRGDEVGWAISTGGQLVMDRTAVRRGWIGNWRITPGQALIAGDFLGVGREMVFCHHGTEVSVIDWNSGSPRLTWFEDVTIGSDPTLPSEGWKIGIADRFLPLRFSGATHTDITVTNGREVSVLSAKGQPDPTMIVAWTSGGRMIQWTGGEMAAVRPGRDLQGGEQSFLITSSSSLTEVLGPVNEPGVSPIARNGFVIPSMEGLEPWAVAPEDCIYRGNIDGEGGPELIIQRGSRLGAVRWIEGGPRLVWSASETIEGLPLTGTEKVLFGDFVPGGGVEVLVAAGDAWATLQWDTGLQNLAVRNVSQGALPGGWTLQNGQSLFVGQFPPAGEGEAVLIHEGAKIAVARFVPGSGFGAVLVLEDAIGDWPLHADDILMPARLDADPELQIIVRNGARIGVLDLSGPESTFLANLVDEHLELVEIPRFLRGDANGDLEIDISDAVSLLGNLFLGFRAPACDDAADTDDSGELDVSDPISLLSFLFNHGQRPPRPGPYTRGIDPTQDGLGCGS